MSTHHDHAHEHGDACSHDASSRDRRAAYERAVEGLPPLPVWMRVLNAPFIVAIKLYQFTLSPIMGRGCRFWPTCSWYGLEAYRTHGPIRGTRLTLWRILRCNPFGGHGYDPVPPRVETQHNGQTNPAAEARVVKSDPSLRKASDSA